MITLFKMDGTPGYVDTWAGATNRHAVEYVAKYNDRHNTSYCGLDLRYMDLRGINLAGTSMVDCNFSYACLADSNLRHARLINCRFNHADLSGSDLTSCNMSDTVAYCADFQHTQLDDANFNMSHAIGSDFRGADGVNKCNWHGAALHSCDFTNQPWPENTYHEALPHLRNHIDTLDLREHWKTLEGQLKMLGWPGRTWSSPPSSANIKKALKLLGVLIFSDACSPADLGRVASRIPVHMHPQNFLPNVQFLLAIRCARSRQHPEAPWQAVQDMRAAATEGIASCDKEFQIPTDPEWYNRDYMRLQKRKTIRAHAD